MRRTQLRNELNEVEGHQDSTNSENVALKRDKLLLTDEVANLNAKVFASTLSSRDQLLSPAGYLCSPMGQLFLLAGSVVLCLVVSYLHLRVSNIHMQVR